MIKIKRRLVQNTCGERNKCINSRETNLLCIHIEEKESRNQTEYSNHLALS